METLYPNPEPELSEIIVETTTACNIKCIHCAVSNEGYVNKTLRYESFENILPVIKKYKPLVKLNGHGETLAHKRFFDMLDASISAGCRVVFQTNATLLAPEVSKRLLAYAGPEKLCSISISIDGVGDVFNKVRRKADWHEYVNNIKTFRDLRAASNSSYPNLNFQFTTMLLNIHTLPATVGMVKELGGSAITVGDLQEYPTAAGQSVTRDLAYARPFFEEAKRIAKELDVQFVPFPSLIEEMESVPYNVGFPMPAEKKEFASPVILWKAKEEAASQSIPVADPLGEAEPSSIESRHEVVKPVAASYVDVVFAGSNVETPRKPGMVRIKDCTDPWKFAFVQADGGVRPCCWIPETMGNLNAEPFESMWYSQKYKALRAAVASPNPPQECWHCQARGWKWVPELSNPVANQISITIAQRLSEQLPLCGHIDGIVSERGPTARHKVFGWALFDGADPRAHLTLHTELPIEAVQAVLVFRPDVAEVLRGTREILRGFEINLTLKEPVAADVVRDALHVVSDDPKAGRFVLIQPATL